MEPMRSTTWKLERKRSSEKASNGGKRGKSAGLSMLCLVRMKTKASHRDAHAGEWSPQNQKAVSVTASGMWRKSKCMNILKWGELFSELPNLKLFDGLQDAWENQMGGRTSWYLWPYQLSLIYAPKLVSCCREGRKVLSLEWHFWYTARLCQSCWANDFPFSITTLTYMQIKNILLRFGNWLQLLTKQRLADLKGEANFWDF